MFFRNNKISEKCFLKTTKIGFYPIKFYVQKSQLKTQYISDTHNPTTIDEIIANEKYATIITNGISEK